MKTPKKLYMKIKRQKSLNALKLCPKCPKICISEYNLPKCIAIIKPQDQEISKFVSSLTNQISNAQHLVCHFLIFAI